MSIRSTLFLPALYALALAVPTLALAQEDEAEPQVVLDEQPGEQSDAQAPAVDPPGRVARLSFIRGEVTFQAADGNAPEQASLNRPLTSGDRLMTGKDARSELTLGVAALRMDEHSDITVADLDDDIVQFEVNSGTVGVHVRELQNKETVEIDTPNAAIRLVEPGDYRIDIESDGAAVLSVRRGRAEIDAGSGATEVRDGEQARLGRDERTAQVQRLGRPDSFDDWTDERERQLSGRETRRYVSSEVVGYEDLDEYGDWRTEVEYGPVWYPRVAVGWSPYSAGTWAWVSPWGWTWVDTAPWGFAPFHYGRWAHVRSRWCWVPGPRHYRPVYAPALVGWVGSPYTRLSVSVGGPVGWFPLGPREVYVPYRRYSPRYLRRVNVSNTVIVNNTYITNVARNRVTNVHYANQHVPGALITRPRHDFDSRRPPAHREWSTNNRNSYRDGRGDYRREGREGRGDAIDRYNDRYNGGDNDRSNDRRNWRDSRYPRAVLRDGTSGNGSEGSNEIRGRDNAGERNAGWNRDRNDGGSRSNGSGTDNGRKSVPREMMVPGTSGRIYGDRVNSGQLYGEGARGNDRGSSERNRSENWRGNNRTERIEVPRQERIVPDRNLPTPSRDYRSYRVPDRAPQMSQPDRSSRPAPQYERRSMPTPRPDGGSSMGRQSSGANRAVIQGQPRGNDSRGRGGDNNNHRR